MRELMATNLVHSGRAALAAFLRAGIDFVYPPHCVFCQQPIAAELLCEACRAELWPEERPSCLRCGAPAGPYLDTADGCVHCRQDRFAFDTVLRLGVYEGALRTACLKAKQPGAEPLVAALGGLWWEFQHERLVRERLDLVVSVPPHWWRQWSSRQYAATTLGRWLARRLHRPHAASLVRKIRRTPPQHHLSLTARRLNLRGAFRVARGTRLTGARVLLVDDILTTGTTAHEVSRVLRKAGASRIVVAVLARGLGVT